MEHPPIAKSDLTIPTTDEERAVTLDRLRGFALLGIFLINIIAFAYPAGFPGFGTEGNWWDRLSIAGIFCFFESKFFTLFSFMFGVGFALQLSRAEMRGAKFISRYFRRLLALGLFGIAHIIFLWEGDILLLYAVLGLVLIFFRKVSDRGLVIWAVWLLAIPLVLIFLVNSLLLIARLEPSMALELAKADRELENDFAKETAIAIHAHETKSYIDRIPDRIQNYGAISFLLISRIPTVLAMFLLGMYVGRRGILHHPEDHVDLLRKTARRGLLIGGSISLLIGLGILFLPTVSAFMTIFFNQSIAGPLLAFGYGATFVLATMKNPNSLLVTLFTAYGRMALTNYLSQSLIAVLIFEHVVMIYGIVPIVAVSTALGIAIVQMIFSVLWLRYFQYGPMEWLWRSFTYLRFQPILRSK